MITQAPVDFIDPGLANPGRRPLDRGWRERHIQGQRDGTMPPGKIPLTYEDGTPVLDRLGRHRWWSMHVEAATRPGRPSSRAIARQKARAEEQARIAQAGRALAAQVQPGLRPPPGRLCSVDIAGMVLRGPAGGIGVAERMARTLAPLAAGGRHPTAALMAAGAWPSEDALRDALAALGGKLAAVGLRIDRRKAGVRIAKARS